MAKNDWNSNGEATRQYRIADVHANKPPHKRR